MPAGTVALPTVKANDVVNSQGVTFVTRLMTETGAQAADVVRAFRIARDVTGAVARWADVESLDGLIDPVVQNELMTGVDWLVETTSRWWLVQEAGARIVLGAGLSPGISNMMVEAPVVGKVGDSFTFRRFVLSGDATIADRIRSVFELAFAPRQPA